MIDLAGLSDLEKLVLDKLAPGYDRSKVEPGTHEVDFAVRIVGTAKVSEDHESIVNAAIPWDRIAMLALGRMNEATREKIVRAALGEDEIDGALKDEVRAAVDRLKAASRKVKLGPVRLEISTEKPAKEALR